MGAPFAPAVPAPPHPVHPEKEQGRDPPPFGLKRAGEGSTLPRSQRKWKGRVRSLPCAVIVVFVVVVGHSMRGVEWEGMGLWWVRSRSDPPKVRSVVSWPYFRSALGPVPGPRGPGPNPGQSRLDPSKTSMAADLPQLTGLTPSENRLSVYLDETR